MPDPKDKPGLLPGKEGTDYRFVKYGDKVYVVYRVKLPNGKFVNTTWRVEKDDFKALGIDPAKVAKIGQPQFKSLNVFGSSSEIARANRDEHPFDQYLKETRERYGNVSWLGNREFMSVMLMGWAENWSAAELEQRLKRTKWYQGRTDRRRAWELDMSKSDRQNELKLWNTRVSDTLDDLYGPNVDWRGTIKMTELKKVAENIASGKWGDPEEGLETWLRNARTKAEKVEGSAAWIERQQKEEEQRGFMNRPEDVREQLRQDAFKWLGPKGMPDNETLRGWAQDLVSEKRSDGDWQKFLRTQARNLYPWLGTDEAWQDRASSYKSIAEENWGQPIKWDNPMLTQLGQFGADGQPTGKALGYDEFEKLVRSKPQFWSGPKAKEEGFDLFNQLNNVFNGVSA